MDGVARLAVERSAVAAAPTVRRRGLPHRVVVAATFLCAIVDGGGRSGWGRWTERMAAVTGVGGGGRSGWRRRPEWVVAASTTTVVSKEEAVNSDDGGNATGAEKGSDHFFPIAVVNAPSLTSSSSLWSTLADGEIGRRRRQSGTAMAR